MGARVDGWESRDNGYAQPHAWLAEALSMMSANSAAIAAHGFCGCVTSVAC